MEKKIDNYYWAIHFKDINLTDVILPTNQIIAIVKVNGYDEYNILANNNKEFIVSNDEFDHILEQLP